MTKFLFAAALLIAAPVFAQEQMPSKETQQQQKQIPAGTEGSSARSDACRTADAGASPSKPVTGPSSGTASNNSGGASGWHGSGLGGSNTGTTPGASTSDVEQPAVASGLDLSGTAFENAPAKKC
jgi:hypothetical protein